MNPYPPPSNTTGNIQMTSPLTAGVRPQLDASRPSSVPMRPIRMPQMMSTERNNNTNNQLNYQQNQLKSEMYQNYLQNQQIQQQQQQRNVFQSHPQQRQINVQRNDSHQNDLPHTNQQHINIPRNNSQHNLPQNHPQQQYNQEKPGALLRQDSAKLQIHSARRPNVPNQNNHGGEIPSESQRNQMAAPVTLSDQRQLIRPPLSNTNNGTFVNQSQSPNYKQIEMIKTANDRFQSNLQRESTENHKAPLSADDSLNQIKRFPAIDPLPGNIINTQQKPNEIILEPQPRADTGKKQDLINTQISPNPVEPKSKPDNKKLDYNEGTNSSNSSESNETIARFGTELGEKSRKENIKSSTKHPNITNGMVQKNVKFFEEKDTAKTPLLPTKVTLKKKERDAVLPSNVIKSEFHKNDYESGVDETPIVHPNLGNISQAPRKVAKMPRLAARKRLIKKLEKNKYKFPSVLCQNTYGNKKAPKTKAFGSNEELLAFFENSISWKKFKRYEKSAASQSATKDKLVYKPTTNGDVSPKKTPSKLPAPSKINSVGSPTKSPLKSPGTPGTKSLPKTPESPAPVTPLIKKVPMNKIQVGAAPSPNLKTVRSKVGSLANTTHKPGGGNVKIESRKIDLSKAQPRIEAKNDQYKPSGGDKKIEQVKLQWSAKSKIGSLENSTYKPGGGDKKIESVKLDFKEKAKPKVGSKDNVKHVPGGGNIKIENQKLEFKAQSKVGSLDNVKHKPGGGDIKIFDDKTYLRQVSGNCSEGRASGTQNSRNSPQRYKLESRSAPTTPGRKTTVKIKKIITLHNFKETPNVEKVTEVTVTSRMLKKDIKDSEAPLQQEVKLTYSKVSSLKGEENPVEVVKVPAKNYAPVLRPSLSKKDVFNDS